MALRHLHRHVEKMKQDTAAKVARLKDQLGKQPKLRSIP